MQGYIWIYVRNCLDTARGRQTFLTRTPIKRNCMARRSDHQAAQDGGCNRSRGARGEAFTMKPTRCVSNPCRVAISADRRCPNRSTGGVPRHRHASLANGGGNAAQEYPNQLRKPMRKGLLKVLMADKRGQVSIATLRMGDAFSMGLTKQHLRRNI